MSEVSEDKALQSRKITLSSSADGYSLTGPYQKLKKTWKGLLCT